MIAGQKLTAKVREVLADMKEATKADIADRLGVRLKVDFARVVWAVEGLVKTGEAVPIVLNEQGEPIPPFQPLKYRWVTSLVKPRGAVQAKLWEFACLRFASGKPFTAAEAARMAMCNLDYAKRYCRWLWASVYLFTVSRGRAGALFYQVVGGKEHESAPPWNRRAEKRKRAAPSPQPSPTRGEGAEDHRPEACATAPPATPLAAGGMVKKLPIEPCTLFGIRDRCARWPDCMRANLDLALPGEHRIEDHRLKTGATKLDAALEDFGRALVEVAGGIGRAWEIIREMKGELYALAVEEQGHGEPTDGHH